MKTIFSPFYNINSLNELLYLNRYKICNLSKEKEIMDDLLIREGVILNCVDYKKYNNSVLVLEPHPDDFSLSALGYVLDRYNTTVLNIFSKTTLKYFAWINCIKINNDEYEKIRLEESKLSIEKILGEKFYTLKEESMRITHKTESYIKENIIQETLKRVQKNPSISEILVPMGIGKHPDHLIVYDAIMNNYNKWKDYKIILYPEYPYARCKSEYNERISYISKKYIIKPIVVNVENNLEIIANCISSYKSQFDDTNREQMLSIVREDARAIAKEYNMNTPSLVYYEVEGIISEN